MQKHALKPMIQIEWCFYLCSVQICRFWNNYLGNDFFIFIIYRLKTVYGNDRLFSVYNYIQIIRFSSEHMDVSTTSILFKNSIGSIRKWLNSSYRQSPKIVRIDVILRNEIGWYETLMRVWETRSVLSRYRGSCIEYYLYITSWVFPKSNYNCLRKELF